MATATPPTLERSKLVVDVMPDEEDILLPGVLEAMGIV
jgi:hypothetical protein